MHEFSGVVRKGIADDLVRKLVEVSTNYNYDQAITRCKLDNTRGNCEI